MQIHEVAYTVNHSGSLKIPKADIAKMGLCAGDHLRVAFLTNDGSTNVYKEFLISPNGIEDPMLDGKDVLSSISIPVSILQEANIPSEADLQIVCADGAIIISHDTLSGNELKTVLDSFTYAENLMRQLPKDGATALDLLGDCLDEVQEEDFSNEL